jgi:ATP-dependent RNA helicase DeaD
LQKTGTGKTAALDYHFTINRYTDTSTVQAVILVPTRELGHQIFNLEDLQNTFPKFLLQQPAVESH